MEVTKQEYPNLLTSLQPGQAVNVLSDRVKLIGKINTDIADWLAERRKVEDAYVQGLRKLAKRQHPEASTALGVFQTPWQRIVSSVEEIAQAHETFTSKLNNDVETPLRQWAQTNREMQSFNTSQGSLTAMVKEIDAAAKKADKLKNKPDRAAQANGSVDDATAQWESQAPFVFEQLQLADEARLNALREALTLYQTHENDQIERTRSATELCLSSLLTVETADEIKTFAARTISSRPSISSIPRSRRHSTATSSAPPMPPPPRLSEGRTAQRVPSSDRLRPVQENPQQSGGLKGLKRLGTVIGRRKSQVPPSASPEKPRKSSRFGFRREDSSRSFQQVESPPATGHELSPVLSREEQVSPPPSAPRPLQEPLQPDHRENETVPSASEPVTNGQPTPQVAEAQPIITGASVTDDQDPVAPSTSERQPSVDPITQAQQEAATANGDSEDAPRSLTIQDKPIQEDEGEARDAFDSMASQLRLQAQQQTHLRPQSSIRGRRDVRNTIFIPNQEPIQVANGHSPNLSPMPTGTSSTAEAPASINSASPAAAAAASSSPIVKRTGTAGTFPDDRTSDANSVHSSHTLSSISGAFAHPDLHEPGLNASIVETINTWFSEGKVIKSFAIGEVALAYNPFADKDNSPNETVRLDNFQLLEKVAANPSLVTAYTGERDENAGEYSLSLASITKPTPTIAFKYQLHLDPESPSLYSPIIFSPVWQLQETQASVIIGYTLNPLFKIPPDADSLTLRNVAISVNIDSAGEGGKAVNAMMSPTEGASFKRKHSMIVWKFPQLIVSTESQRLLARFITSGAAPKAGHIEAKWELQEVTGSALGVSAMSGASGDVDPFADESIAVTPTKTWTAIPVSRKLVTGRYSSS